MHCHLPETSVFMIAMVFAGVTALAAAPAGKTAGLETKARIGKQIKKGWRGPGLQVTGAPKTAMPVPGALKGQSGTIRMFLRLDKAGADSGVILTAADKRLSWIIREQTPYLQFRVADWTVSKPVYDWLPGNWRYLVLSWDRNRPALYIDGVIGSKPIPAQDTAPSQPSGLAFGGGPGTLTFSRMKIQNTGLSLDDAARVSRMARTGKVAQRKPLLAITRATTPPKIDGRLEPGEWDRAAGFSNFAVHYGTRIPSTVRGARAWITWDDKALYMGFKIPVTERMSNQKRERDRIIFGSRTVEIFLQPNPSGELEYYQLAFDPAGTRYDSRISDVSRNPDWTVVSHADEEWWIAEAAIPYKSIGAIPPKHGARWKMNMVCASGQWSHSGSYHNANRFGLLKFIDKAPSVNVGTIERQGDRLLIPYHLAGNGDGLELKVNCYPEKGVSLLASARKVLTAAQPGGKLSLDVKSGTSALLEIVAFTDPGNPVYIRYVPINDKYLSAIKFFKNLPPDQKRPKKAKVDKAMTTADRKRAEAEDFRPTTDQIEKALTEQQKWLGNDIGKFPLLPKPWTPIRVQGLRASCWAKVFDFRQSMGLPRQVSILEQPVFSAPCSWVSNTRASRPRLFVVSEEPHAMRMIGQQDFGNVRLTMRSRLEFDGFIKYELTLAPMRENATLDGFSLRIPFQAKHAKYYHWWSGNAYARPCMETANFLDHDMQSGYEAQVWIGDEERGFCWFAESPKNWSHPDARDLITITRTRRTTDLAIRFIKGKITLKKPLSLVFGMMATPAKPRPSKWRTWEGRFGTDWVWYQAFSFPYPPKNPKRFTAKMKNPFYMPMLSVFFAGICFMDDGRPVPEQWIWGRTWSARWNKPTPPYGKVNGKKGKIVSYSSMAMATSWPDYYLYRLKELRRKYGLRSVYLDTCIRETTNPFAGYTWKDATGKVRGSMDIFAFRETAKRIRNFIHEDPEAFIIMHHSNQVCIPILSFMDTHMNGEHFNTGPHQVQGRNYVDVCPPGTFRACFSLKQWGVVPTFLPEHPASTRSMLGYFWVHDTGLYNAWCNHAQYETAVRAKQSFGLADVEFLGYWLKNAPADPLPERTYVSAYRKLDSSAALLIVANMQEHDRTITVRLRQETLRIPFAGREITGRDIEWNKDLVIVNGVLAIPVHGQDFRMIRIDNIQ